MNALTSAASGDETAKRLVERTNALVAEILALSGVKRLTIWFKDRSINYTVSAEGDVAGVAGGKHDLETRLALLMRVGVGFLYIQQGALLYGVRLAESTWAPIAEADIMRMGIREELSIGGEVRVAFLSGTQWHSEPGSKAKE